MGYINHGQPCMYTGYGVFSKGKKDSIQKQFFLPRINLILQFAVHRGRIETEQMEAVFHWLGVDLANGSFILGTSRDTFIELGHVSGQVTFWAGSIWVG